MSDLPPPGGERNMGGTAASFFQRVGGRLFSGGRSSAASAALKFDIGGLTKFKDEIDKIRNSIKDLNTKFNELSRAPRRSLPSWRRSTSNSLT
jgi:hypothetical protein